MLPQSSTHVGAVIWTQSSVSPVNGGTLNTLSPTSLQGSDNIHLCDQSLSSTKKAIDNMLLGPICSGFLFSSFPSTNSAIYHLISIFFAGGSCSAVNGRLGIHASATKENARGSVLDWTVCHSRCPRQSNAAVGQKVIEEAQACLLLWTRHDYWILAG